jgi:hypothetical protein
MYLALLPGRGLVRSRLKRGLWVACRKKSGDLKGGRRMYIGLSTVLLIVLIIILLIWVF